MQLYNPAPEACNFTRAMPPTADPGPACDPAPVNGTVCSDPVTVSSGNLFQQQVELVSKGSID